MIVNQLEPFICHGSRKCGDTHRNHFRTRRNLPTVSATSAANFVFQTQITFLLFFYTERVRHFAPVLPARFFWSRGLSMP